MTTENSTSAVRARVGTVTKDPGLDPVVTVGDVPQAIRDRIGQLFAETLEMSESLVRLLGRYGDLVGALDALGDGVDDRALQLAKGTGLEAVLCLLGDMSWRIGTSICVDDEPLEAGLRCYPERLWPESAGPCPVPSPVSVLTGGPKVAGR